MKKLPFIIITIITGRAISAKTSVKNPNVNIKELADNPITGDGNRGTG